jgi:tRNA(Ile)-lysidine synthase
MRRATVRTAAFDADWLAPRLARIAGAASAGQRFLVGWSGGADSTALLAALCELRARAPRTAAFGLRAIHVDHGLQARSRDWARRCRALARRLHVPLTTVRVGVRRERGLSPEAAAREARYAAFEAVLKPGEILLLAHHADDQIETVLLQFLRGAGPAGLAAMPERRELGPGLLARPLLEADPADLRAYLRARRIDWIEDPSNADTDVDRNYLRREVLPRLAARWPSLRQTTARSVALLQSARRELDEATARDLARVADGEGLSVPLLRRLPAERLRAVLRAWLARHATVAPDRSRLESLVAMLDVREDARPEIAWGTVKVRRHVDRLLLVRAAEPHATDTIAREWRWSAAATLELPAGTLRIVRDRHGDLDLDRLPGTIAVRARAPGRDREPGGRSVDVKSLLRESGVPHWERDRLPFLHDPRADAREGSLIAIGDAWLATSVRAGAESRDRGRIVWRPT